MADAFGIGAGIVDVIGLTVQIAQVLVNFGIDWKESPHSVKAFVAELGTLKTVLSETNTNIIVNPDFAAVFTDRPSLLLSQLGSEAPSITETKRMLESCQGELEFLLKELKKRGEGDKSGWQRIKSAFQAKRTRESVEKLCQQCQSLNNMLSVDVAVLGAATYKEEWRQTESQRQENRERQTILNWIAAIDYPKLQSDIIAQRQEGTGQWLLDSDEFHTWIKYDKRTLFCPGIPGAGKTILASIVIDYLQTEYLGDPTIGIAYLYCNFRRQHEQKPENLIAGLLKQLTQQQLQLPESVKLLYNRQQIKQTRPSLEELFRLLQVVVAVYSRVYIVIDALDECQSSGGHRSSFLSRIFDLQQKTKANIFATSRPILDIEKHFKQCLSREIIASDSDIRRYLDGHMIQLPTCVLSKPNLQEEIKTQVARAVNGMFLLARLYLMSLKDKTTPKEIKIALQQFQQQSQGSSENKRLEILSQVYEEAMKRINSQPEGFQQLANRVLSWITCAQRPLTTIELQHALAVELDESEFDEDNLPEIEQIVSICAGLVIVDEESDIIRLVHHTTQEYFQRTQGRWFPTAEIDITATCITYLSLDIFEEGACQTNTAYEERLQLNPFFDYAARNWGYHARNTIFNQKLSKIIFEFLGSKEKFDASIQGLFAIWLGNSYYVHHFPRMNSLHLAAYFGIQVLVQLLLEKGAVVESKDRYGRTPLLWASRNGNSAVVQLLLEKGALTESKDRNYARGPLSWASGEGHEAVVQLLLQKGAVVESKDMYDRTPLFWATEKGHEAVIRLLLEVGALIESKDAYGRTPLFWAARSGYETIVRLLLDEGAVIQSKERYDQTPLSWAAEEGHETVVQLLLKKGAVIESKDRYGQTPLSWAARVGREAVVQLLLEKRAIIETKDEYDQTPLLWAARSGHEAIVRLLLDEGAVIESKDKYGQTPLSWATEKGYEAVVHLLLQKGATTESKDKACDQIPLSRATENGHKTDFQPEDFYGFQSFVTQKDIYSTN